MNERLTFAQRVQEQRRLALLTLLAATPTYEANESLLQQALPDQGVASSLDQVRADLAWLSEQGYCTTDYLAGTMLARVTARGVDVVNGFAIVPGVARPGPGNR